MKHCCDIDETYPVGNCWRLNVLKLRTSLLSITSLHCQTNRVPTQGIWLKSFQSNTALQLKTIRIDNLIDETLPLGGQSFEFESRELSDLIKTSAIHRLLRCRRKKDIFWFLVALPANVDNFGCKPSKSKSVVEEWADQVRRRGWKTPCFKIGYSEPREADSREGSSTPSESSRVT